MSGLRVSLTTSGFSKASKRLEGAAELAKNPSPPAKAAAEWLAGKTMQTFALGGHDGEWAPLSNVTMFIRKYRSQSPRNSSTPGSDTGQLKGSFVPFVDSDGGAFGAGTNVDYAADFEDGGPSKPNTVLIGQFTRRAPGAKAAQVLAYTRGKVQRATRVTVHPFFMHFKGGSNVPARRFFPDGMSDMRSWGYLDKVRQIFALEFGDRLGGTA